MRCGLWVFMISFFFEILKFSFIQKEDTLDKNCLVACIAADGDDSFYDGDKQIMKQFHFNKSALLMASTTWWIWNYEVKYLLCLLCVGTCLSCDMSIISHSFIPDGESLAHLLASPLDEFV